MNVLVLTNTIDNAGDHLHRFASLRLIQSKIDIASFKEMDRMAAGLPENESILEFSDIIFIPGGPSFRKNLIPNICNVPEKFWYKTALFGSGVKHRDSAPFNTSTLRFLNSSLPISVRDLTTMSVADNVVSSNHVHMTGCPVSALTPKMIDDDFGAISNEGRLSIDIAISDGQDYNKGANQVVSHLAKLIPKSTVIRHTHRNTGLQEESSVVAIGGSHEKLISAYRNYRVHIGFRVHAHLLCLALGVPSLLIVEDERGASLARQYGCETIDLRNPLYLLKILNRLGANTLSDFIAQKQAKHISRKFNEVPDKIQTYFKVKDGWDTFFLDLIETLKSRKEQRIN